MTKAMKLAIVCAVSALALPGCNLVAVVIEGKPEEAKKVLDAILEQ